MTWAGEIAGRVEVRDRQVPSGRSVMSICDPMGSCCPSLSIANCQAAQTLSTWGMRDAIQPVSSY